MKSILFLIICGFIPKLYAQKGDLRNDLKSGDVILTYDIADKSTVDLINHLLADTSTLILFENVEPLRMKCINAGIYQIGGGEEPMCDATTEEWAKLDASGRVFTYSPSLNYEKFCSYYLINQDQQLYTQILNKFNTTSELIVTLPEQERDSVIDEIVYKYHLSSIDSLLIVSSLQNRFLQADDFREIGISKKIIFLHCGYEIGNGVNDFLSDSRNKFVLVPRNGSKNLKGSPLNIHNRIKKQEEYSLITFNRLPKKIILSKRDKLKKDQLKDCQFIYISELDNCLW